MKLKIYCTKCGHANMYAAEKPNFCQKCGSAFAHANIESPQTPQTPEHKEDSMPFTSEGMTGLDVEIIGDQRDKAPTIEDLINSPERKWTNKELDIKGKRGRRKKFNKDEVQRQFQKEAGTIRKDKPK